MPKVKLTPDSAIKDVITGITDLCNFILNVSQGFSFGEIAEAIGLASDLHTVMGELPSIVAQYQTMDAQAQQDLFAYIAQNVSLPQNANVQAIVEKCLEVGVALSQIYQLITAAPATPAA